MTFNQSNNSGWKVYVVIDHDYDAFVGAYNIVIYHEGGPRTMGDGTDAIFSDRYFQDINI